MNIKTNQHTLMKQALVGKISPPTLPVQGGFIGGYVTTWNGKPKLGIGIGGIKYNVKVGDPCTGWPETENLEPGIALMGTEEKPDTSSYMMTNTGRAFIKYSCIGNTTIMITGDAKNTTGTVTGKGGVSQTRKHVTAHFPQKALEKMNIGDKARIVAYGTGLKIDGFNGEIANLSPKLLELMKPQLDDDTLTLPATRTLPIIVMGFGVGGGQPQEGNWCIQTTPPHLSEKYGLDTLRIGDLVAVQDAWMLYGKGYYRGATTIGVIATGASEVAGLGPGLLPIATSKKGRLKVRHDPDANLKKLLKLEDQ